MWSLPCPGTLFKLVIRTCGLLCWDWFICDELMLQLQLMWKSVKKSKENGDLNIHLWSWSNCSCVGLEGTPMGRQKYPILRTKLFKWIMCWGSNHNTAHNRGLNPGDILASQRRCSSDWLLQFVLPLWQGDKTDLSMKHLHIKQVSLKPS